MGTYKKVRILHITALVFIWIDLLVSLILSSCLFLIKMNIYLTIFLFLVLLIIISCLFAFVGFYIFNYILRKIIPKVSTISINFELSKPNLACLELDSNTSIYYWIKRHLNTITIYNTDNLDIKKFKTIFKKSRNIVKKNIFIANEKYTKKKHWQFDINILTYQEISINNLSELISKINNFQLYEIGKFTIGYMQSTATIIIKTFDAKQISFVSLNNYHKCIKYICKYFDLPFKEIVRVL